MHLLMYIYRCICTGIKKKSENGEKQTIGEKNGGQKKKYEKKKNTPRAGHVFSIYIVLYMNMQGGMLYIKHISHTFRGSMLYSPYIYLRHFLLGRYIVDAKLLQCISAV